MGWITVGNLEFYSVSDTIINITIQLFTIITKYGIIQITSVILLFFLTMAIYFFTAIKQKVKESTERIWLKKQGFKQSCKY